MIDASSLLGDEVVGDLIGVIDLKQGQAVHAKAGERSKYQPVRFGADDSNYGDAFALARHYHQLGLRRLYIADLDSIQRRPPQSELLSQMAAEFASWDEVLVDVGWRDGLGLPTPVLDAPNVSIIAATESAQSTDALQQLVSIVSPERTLVSFDYRNGEFVSQSGTQAEWFELANRLNIQRCVVLDVASVGTGDCSSNVAVCRVVKESLPSIHIYSGGGIRCREDLQRLSKAGCDRFLVATGLH